MSRRVDRHQEIAVSSCSGGPFSSGHGVPFHLATTTDVIRVTDAATAAKVRAEVREAIPVTVAPTPELDALLAHLIATLPPDEDNEPSYFASGRVSAAAVEKLFAARRLLFAVQPWTVADDTQVLRMDIPVLSVDGPTCRSSVNSARAAAY